MSHRRALTLAATSLLALGLTACGDDAAKPETESASTSAGPTTSAAPATTSTAAETTPVTTPPASTAPAVAAPDPADYPGMDQQTEEGAKQAYRYFWDSIVFGYVAGDSSQVKSMSLPECAYCNEVSADIDSISSAGGVWSQTQIQEILMESSQGSPGVVSLDFGFIIPEHTESPSAESAPEFEPSTAFASGAELRWKDDGWKVFGVDLQAVPKTE